jgi:hypothetical protein
MAGMRGEMGMTRLLSRTSITIDEAIYILLGRSTGPIEFEPIGESEDAEANAPVFCLFETLDDELEVLTGEYEIAKYEKRPADVIAEKLAALQHQEAVREQAYQHLCAFNDELNKGEQSVLKVDQTLSNAAYTFITLHSFNEWRKCSADSVEDAVKEELRIRQRDQEEAILAEIRSRGMDPLALPPIRQDARVSRRPFVRRYENRRYSKGRRYLTRLGKGFAPTPV